MEIMVRRNNTTPLGTTSLRLQLGDPKTVGTCTNRTRARHILGAGKIKLNNYQNKKQPNRLRIGSWNVSSMTGKSLDLEEMMLRRSLDILCVQETKWSNRSNKTRFLDTRTKSFKLFFHGDTNGKNGVGIIVSSEWLQNIVNICKVSDRIMSIKLVVGRQVWNIVSVYAPQVGLSAEEKEKFWRELEDLMKKIPFEEKIFVGGDLNGHVGTTNAGDKRWHGGYGVGVRNPEGDTIVDFAKAHDLSIVNTFFKKQHRHLVTFTNGRHETQIDYHLCSRDIRNSIKDCKVIIGDNFVTQHRLLVSVIHLDNKRKRETQMRTERIKWFKMDVDEGSEFVRQAGELISDMVQKSDELDAEQMWMTCENKIKELAMKELGVSKGPLKIKKEAWLWKTPQVREAVLQKKLAYKNWEKCDYADLAERQRLREIYVLRRREARKAVTQARTDESQNWYESF